MHVIAGGYFSGLPGNIGIVRSCSIVCTVHGAECLRIKWYLWSSSACFAFVFGAMGGTGRAGLIFRFFVQIVYLLLTLVVRCWDFFCFSGRWTGLSVVRRWCRVEAGGSRFAESE